MTAAAYARAAEYCRGDVARPIALSPDQSILCFDGPLVYGQDYAAVKALEYGGLSWSGAGAATWIPPAALADLVRDRHAIVVVEGRAIDRLFESPPESFVIRRRLQHLLEDTEQYPDVMWTWNPRYYADVLITKIVYEAHPKARLKSTRWRQGFM